MTSSTRLCLLYKAFICFVNIQPGHLWLYPIALASIDPRNPFVGMRNKWLQRPGQIHTELFGATSGLYLPTLVRFGPTSLLIRHGFRSNPTLLSRRCYENRCKSSTFCWRLENQLHKFGFVQIVLHFYGPNDFDKLPAGYRSVKVRWPQAKPFVQVEVCDISRWSRMHVVNFVYQIVGAYV